MLSKLAILLFTKSLLTYFFAFSKLQVLTYMVIYILQNNKNTITRKNMNEVFS